MYLHSSAPKVSYSLLGDSHAYTGSSTPLVPHLLRTGQPYVQTLLHFANSVLSLEQAHVHLHQYPNISTLSLYGTIPHVSTAVLWYFHTLLQVGKPHVHILVGYTKQHHVVPDRSISGWSSPTNVSYVVLIFLLEVVQEGLLVTHCNSPADQPEKLVRAPAHHLNAGET